MFSLLDRFFGYNQVPVSKAGMLKTTFWTKWETFCFYRMPYGLKNLKSMFQLDMDMTFHGLINHDMVVYPGDVTIFSKKREDHIHHLK